jgi:predicted TIM-barrel fold metal-dependent hydrolase
MSRRQLLASGLAIGASHFFGSGSWATDAVPKMGPGTIDVHHHFFPPAIMDATYRFLKGVYGEVPEWIKNWSPAHAIETLDRNGIAKAVLCTSARPASAEVGVDAFRIQARSCNDYGAKMVRDHPKRFAQFGFLPMPDVDGSLKEIEYTLDVLKAPGVGMMTSYGNRWQGNPAFSPVLEELNRRKAVVFCHPLPAACCSALMPDVAPRESQLVEFPYDTGRAVVGLLMSGSFSKYPNIRWIFCHSGDTVPVLTGRMKTVIAEMPQEEVAKILPRGMDYELQRQFYDTADGAYGPSMAALMNYVPNTQVLFGTDFPYVTIESNAQQLYNRRLPKQEMAAIQHENALCLMPQLA